MFAGAYPDKYRDETGNTALLEAASLGENTIVSMLVYGVDLNIQNLDGKTALHRAADSGHNDVIQILNFRDDFASHYEDLRKIILSRNYAN